MDCDPQLKRLSYSISHPTKGEYTWAFHDSVEIGPNMLAKTPNTLDSNRRIYNAGHSFAPHI